MHPQLESNPHFLPRRTDPFQPPQQRHRQPTSLHPVDSPPHDESFTHVTYIEPHPPRKPRTQPESDPRLSAAPLPAPLPQTPHSPGRGQHSPQHRRHLPQLRGPTSQRTKPVYWLVAAFCVLFWIIVIIGGLIILIVYLVFRPRNPRFDISSATFNAAYLDMGYLLNADVTLLANFTNPNTKVNVDFTYIVLDIYYEKRFVATRYIDPFSVMRRESRFADVHMVASQVRLSMGHSLELQKQIAAGRVNFEIRGLFKTRSRFGGIFQYTYWLYAHCHIVVGGPPTGVLIRKGCVTKR